MRVVFEQGYPTVSEGGGRRGQVVTCIQRERLVFRPDAHKVLLLAHAQRAGLGWGGKVVWLSMGTYVILPLWRTIS